MSQIEVCCCTPLYLILAKEMQPFEEQVMLLLSCKDSAIMLCRLDVNLVQYTFKLGQYGSTTCEAIYDNTAIHST